MLTDRASSCVSSFSALGLTCRLRLGAVLCTFISQVCTEASYRHAVISSVRSALELSYSLSVMSHTSMQTSRPSVWKLWLNNCTCNDIKIISNNISDLLHQFLMIKFVLFVCMSLNVCVCTLCVQCPWRQEERIRCPATGVTIGCESPCGDGY